MIVITGFHRSGTSAVAGALHAAGVKMGPLSEFIGPHPSNEKGHFENLRIVNINDAILRYNRSTWNNVIGPVKAVPKMFGETVNELVREHGTDIVVKDPRFCLTIGVWKDHLASLVNKVIIVVRNPVECAMSLQHRDGMSMDDAFFLWNRYIRDLLAHTAGLPRHFIAYEELLGDPKSVLMKALSFVGGAVPQPCFEAACGFVEGRLKHNRAGEYKLPDETVEIMGLLNDATLDK